MSATLSQFATLLDLLSEPARVYDVQGRVVAENLAAHGAIWPEDTGGDETHISTVELGEGWYLRRMDVLHALPALGDAVADLPLARPNLQALLAGITHELRNPMAAILTAVSLLQDDSGLSEESSMLLGVVRKEARRMNQIMTEFSLYVKPPQPRPENFDLARLIRDTVAQFQAESTLWQSVTVRDTMPAELAVHADCGQMQQALCRILENAVEAMNKNLQPMLALRGHAETERIIICIEDNGAGLSPDDLQRAFLPFYSTKPQSTGLGLSTALVAVQAAGGLLWLENVGDEPHLPVSGARVCFALPCAK